MLFSRLHSALASHKSGFVSRQWERVHKVACRLIDPDVCVRIGQRRLWMKFSHPLPFLLSRHKYYDSLVPRLAAALRPAGEELRVIDVGANVGDTTSLLLDRVPARVLAIEPDADYFQFLLKNTAGLANVTCVRAALTDIDDGGQDEVVLTKVGGTAFMAQAGGLTLDSLLAAHGAFAGAQLLKVDTDGFDYKVLKGARGFLTAAKPAIFFELSPEHFEKVGHEKPAEVFEFLAGLGYATFAFYDNEGCLMFSGGPADQRFFEEAIRYARSKDHYYDVLAFHARAGGLAGRFLEEERRVFQPYERAFLGSR